MNSSKTILSETQAISQAVANLPKTNPFTLSQEYFELFSINLLRTIQQSEQKALSTPENYFSTFPSKLLEKIKEENSTAELEGLSPILAGMQKQNPFYVPENYFATFNATPKKEQGIIRSVFSYKRIMRYAAAACITGLLIISYTYNQHNATSPLAAQQKNSASDLSLESIIGYLDEVDDVKDDNENDTPITAENNLLVDINQETIRQVLQEIPENDIKQFIDQTGSTEYKSLN
jgi:hypothetical protein